MESFVAEVARVGIIALFTVFNTARHADILLVVHVHSPVAFVVLFFSTVAHSSGFIKCQFISEMTSLASFTISTDSTIKHTILASTSGIHVHVNLRAELLTTEEVAIAINLERESINAQVAG